MVQFRNLSAYGEVKKLISLLYYNLVVSILFLSCVISSCRNKPFPEHIVRNIIYQILQAVVYMHRYGNSYIKNNIDVDFQVVCVVEAA